MKLVNKYAELHEQKKATEEEIEKVRQAIAELSKKAGLGRIQGSDAELIVRFYPKTGFPKKDDPARREL